MKSIIQIENLTFKYHDIVVFENLNLEIKKASFTTILGANGSGKSTLIKLILGLIKGTNFVSIDDLPVNKENLRKIRKKIGVVFQNPSSGFVAETVADEIAFSLENLRLEPKKIEEKVNNLANKLGLEAILEYEPHHLDVQAKQLVALASALIIEPEILIIDDGLNNLDNDKKNEVLEFLKELNKTRGMTIINITDDVEDCLFGTDIIILKDKKVALSDKTEIVLENEEIFNESKLELPFIIALSNKLKFYNLIDKTYYDSEKLVDDLWK